MPKERSNRADAQRLFAAALDCLERGDPKRALRLARNMDLLGFSGAFEIRALVHIDRSQPDRAIAVLRKGIDKAPDSWRLWELLGNLLSDSGRFDEAQTSYERSLACPDTDRSTILYNSAIAYARQGLFERSLERLSGVSASELAINASLLEASLLTSLKRTDEAIVIARQVIARLTDPAARQETADEDLAAAYSELARAHWEGRCDASEALKTAWKALERGRRNFLAMRIVREARGRRSPRTRRWHCLMKGRWFEPFEGESLIPGFFRNYEVLAESPLECLEFVREFEPDLVRDTLEIESIKAVEDCPDEPRGLVAAEGYMFWEQDDSERPRVTN